LPSGEARLTAPSHMYAVLIKWQITMIILTIVRQLSECYSMLELSYIVIMLNSDIKHQTNKQNMHVSTMS
jgi:hypothetical protein